MACTINNGVTSITSAGGLSLSSMCYKTFIVKAIEDLKDYQNGSSLSAIKKHAQASIPDDKVWRDAVFLRTIKTMVEKGDLVKAEDHYKLSPKFKKQREEDIRDIIAMEEAKHHVTPKSPEATKPVAKFKPALVKKKLLDSKIITIVKPGRKTEKMTVDEKEKPKEPDEKPTAAKKTERDKVKIIPHKIIAKRGYVCYGRSYAGSALCMYYIVVLGML